MIRSFYHLLRIRSLGLLGEKAFSYNLFTPLLPRLLSLLVWNLFLGAVCCFAAWTLLRELYRLRKEGFTLR